MANSDMLLEMLVDDLESKFLRELLQRTPIIYRESESRSHKDKDIHEAYKGYQFGHARFGLFQSMFLNLAKDCGLTFKVDKCPENGFPIAIVTCGRFYFTAHYGYTADDITCQHSSLVRQQHAAVNKDLVREQPSLFESPELNLATLKDATDIYANIIHGCRGDGIDFQSGGFMRIAIPSLKKSADGKSLQMFFVKNYDLPEVHKLVIEKERAAKTEEPVIDIAIPKLKIVKSGAEE